MRFDFVQKHISKLFQYYIKLVIRCPWPFILIPIFLTAVLSTGLRHQQQSFLKDDLDQYVPINAPARKELQQLDQLFHIDDLDPFYATRRYDIKRTGFIIVTSIIDGDDVLRPAILESALGLWNLIQRLTVEGRNDTTFNYPSICVKFPISPEFDEIIASILSHNSSRLQEKCVSNPLIAAFKMLLNGKFNLKNGTIDQALLKLITNAFSPDLLTGVANLLGGITYDDKHRISGAKAIMLPYALRHSTAFQDNLAEKWELKLTDFILQYTSSIIRTSLWTYETLAAESAQDREQLLKMLLPCFVLVLLYTVACCCLPSWIYSRPWLATAGVISAAAAVISGVGLLLLLGYRITSVAYSMPFVVFSVGVDNVFIALSAWRSTSLTAPFELRMKDAFSDAAISITVTSLTDLISFAVGCFAPFRSVQIFCLYAVSAVLFTYIYQLTFFSVSPYKIHTLYLPSVKEEETISHRNHLLADFFRTSYSNFLLKPVVRLVVLVAFFLYLMLSIWGCAHVKLGLEPNDLLPANSYGREALAVAEKYFSDYGSYLHVWMYNLSKYNFSNRKIWIVLDNEIALYEYTEYTGPSDSWLRALMQYSQKNNIEITSDNFAYVVKNIFLTQPQFARYKRDVLFDVTGNLLDVSRVLVQLRHIGASNQSQAMRIFRNIAKSSTIETGVYADFFQFAEQYSAVLPGTLSTILIASIAVIIVSLLLIPETTASFWISLNIISVNLGILGFMTFWNVRLDFVSMITIVMSIGFCVDYASHLAFNFAKGKGIESSERMRSALYSVGVPILQSASSTIIGVSFLAFVDSYVFRSFLKTIILVITLGTIHGLLILPILLTLFSCDSTAYIVSETEASKMRTIESTPHSSAPTWYESPAYTAEETRKCSKCVKMLQKTKTLSGSSRSVMVPHLDASALQPYWDDRYYYPKPYDKHWNRKLTNVLQEEIARRKSCPNFYTSFTAPSYG